MKQANSIIKRFICLILDTIFPPKCIFCNAILPSGIEIEICPACYQTAPFVRGKTCIQCGQPISGAKDIHKCADCSKKEYYFKQGISVFEYKGMVKKAIIRLKFFGKKRYAVTLGKLMGQALRKMTNWPIIDLIVYIPLHPKRFRERGYNQARLLADEIGRQLGWRIGQNVIFKTKNATAQSKLTRFQRQKNLKNAFRFNTKTKIKGATVLLVDDVYTTGTTVNECARLLHKAGANEIYVITAAIGKGTY